MPDPRGVALAVLLTVAAGPAVSATSPEPPVDTRAGAEASALPLGTRHPVPSVADVLGAAPGVKLASLGGAALGWRQAPHRRAERLWPLAASLSVLALAGLGSARRQAAYRWMLRR